MRPSRHLAYNSISLEGWTGNYRHRYSIKLSKNKTDLKVYQILPILSSKISCCVYWLNLVLMSNPGLAFFRQKQILKSNRHKNLQKQTNEDFFVQLLNAWIHLANNNLPTLTSAEEILDQPIFLNPHTKPDFSSGNPYFYCSPPNNISDNFTEKTFSIGKKVIVNQILLSKLWYIGQIYTIPEYAKTKLKECTISSGTENKCDLPGT